MAWAGARSALDSSRSDDDRRDRRAFLEFFEANGHRPMPSAPLVPPPSDTSTLLIIAGRQPLKPYLLGIEAPRTTGS